MTAAQKALIRPILEKRDVILQAGTGSGKTEAVLAPATERLLTDRDPFTILYLVPTRALALDMHRRIQPLYKQLGLKSGIRTGDGKTLQEAKPDLLILTPESLDVLLGSKNQENKYFLRHVRILILDEIHTFIRTERGSQLFYLKRRLEAQLKGDLQTLALSATIANPEEISSFFRLNDVFYYRKSATQILEPRWVHILNERQELVPFFDDLLSRWKCKKLLVFANSRKKCEQLFEILNHEGSFSGNVLLHYSNLSTKERRFVESCFRNRKQTLCIATSTLEMGIDIGDIDGVVLIGPPPSTMAFVQRIGRGNRRQKTLKFWGICYGVEAEHQLLRFLALFELRDRSEINFTFIEEKSDSAFQDFPAVGISRIPVRENRQQDESTFPSKNAKVIFKRSPTLENEMERVPEDNEKQREMVRHHSVLFQQVLSCLYAKGAVSYKSLEVLFNEVELSFVMKEMIAKDWLCLKDRSEIKFTFVEEKNDSPNQTLQISNDLGILHGGWRYRISLQRQQIWSNFPPTDKEYEVILDEEVIAVLPLSIIKQLQVGDIFQLAGKKLKLLRIEEKKTSQEVFVEISDQSIDKELSWCGFGTVISFEIAQAMKSVLLDKHEPRGMLARTKRLLENERRPYVQAKIQGNNGLYVHRLNFGGYRYETFLGTIGNFVLYQQIKYQLTPKIKGLSVRFNELGIETNEWISFQVLQLPLTVSDFQKWVSAHLPLLQQAFPWNCWLYSLPEELQKKEISSTLLDLRVLEHFKKYRIESMPLPPPPLDENHPIEKRIPLKGKPLSFEEERQTWGQLSFPEIPQEVDRGLTASQLQNYVARGTCPRLAHFQRVGFSIKPHPRFQTLRQKSDFKSQIFQTLNNVRFETADFTLKQAIDEVSTTKVPLFLARAKLTIDHPFSMRGSPDLIYLKYEGSCVHLEVWDIKDQEIISYAQKWRLAFYVYLLKRLLQETSVIISECAGLVHRVGTEQKRTPFALRYFTSWITHLIDMWRVHSLKPPDQYSLNSSCTVCPYFSYCYQETLFKTPASVHDPVIVCTAPESIDLPPNIDDWPSIRSFLQKHFIWPIDGCLSAIQVARCLGLIPHLPSGKDVNFISERSFSLYHDEPCPELHKQIWNWCTSHVKITRSTLSQPVGLIDTYLYTQRREWEERTLAILEFQKNPLPVRVEQFRSVGPLTFSDIIFEGQMAQYSFFMDPKAPIAKFRQGDFLKLSSLNGMQVQNGFSVILTSYTPEKGRLCVQPLSGKIPICKNQLYALDECATDWNAPKIENVLHRLRDPKFRPELLQMLQGHGKSATNIAAEWVEQWYALRGSEARLNSTQKRALLLPFLKNIGLIEGPPGTGKTHLLVWTLIALIAYAKSIHRPIKILVTALTHQAIDQILLKVANTLDAKEKIPLWKYERLGQSKPGVELLKDAKSLTQNTSFILGATGFGVYQLFESQQFPRIFDWIIFDEASQVLPSYAFLSLIFGKGNALFYGDTQQLSPIVMADIPARSILEELIFRFGSEHRLQLDETYRMNEPICQFISDHWYDKKLQSAVADQRLELSSYPLFADSIDDSLNPVEPLTVVSVEHEGNLQSSKEEAMWIAKALKRLIIDYAFPVDEIGIISPHRLQNNTILNAIKESLAFHTKYPKIDTVERMQGQEFDLVIFSATVSVRDALHNAFLKDYRRFNVSISRARKKFLFVASPLFFKSFPKSETELIAHFPFNDFFTRALE